MRVTITGINFKYADGYDGEYTGVELQYITNGFKFTNNTRVEITKEQYEQNKSDTNGLRALIVEKQLEEVNGFIEQLNTYKDELTGAK